MSPSAGARGSSPSREAEPEGRPPGQRWLLRAAAIVVVVAGLRAGAPFILPLLLAVFIALLSFPVVDFLCRHRVRLTLAVLATVLLEAGLLLVLGLLIAPTLDAFAQAAPGYLEQLNQKFRLAIDGLEARGIRLSDLVAFERVDPGQLVDFAGSVVRRTVTGVASAVSFSTLVLFILIFMLLESAGIPDKLRTAFGGGSRLPDYLASVTREVQRYLAVKTAVSAATGVILGACVWALQVPFAPVWGLVAFLLNFVPSIGSIIAAVPAILVALLIHGPGRAAAVALAYLVVNFVIGNIVEPTLMGRRFGLSTLVVFLSLIFWGWVWGPLGMLLSVPLTMMLKIALQQSEQLRWAAVLLGPARPAPAEPAAGPASPSEG